MRDFPPAQSKTIAVLLTCLVALGPISTDLYLPSLPDLVRSFDSTVGMGQLTLSVFIAAFAVAQLVYGPLSDRFGRRPVLLAGLAIYIAATLFCMAAPTIEALIGGRFLQALGACSGPVLGRAVVRDVYPRDMAARVLSYMASAMAIAPLLAPMLSGLLHGLIGWRGNFGLLVLTGAGLLAATWRLLAETNHHRSESVHPGAIVATYVRLLRDGRFVGYVVVGGSAFTALFAFVSGSSFVLDQVYRLPPHLFGLAFGACVLGFMAGTFASGRLSLKVGAQRLLAIGTLLAPLGGLLAAGLAWAAVPHILALIVPVSLMFLACGLILPNATASAIAPYPRAAGAASALLGAIQMGVAAVAGLLVGQLHDGTARPMTSVMLGGAIVAFLAYRLLVKGREMPA